MKSDELETECIQPPPTALLDNKSNANRRRICVNGCERPVNVCLCDKIPKPPIFTTTQILILQHPHEQRHKLATVPVLSKCLQNCQILIGRRLRRGASPLLDSLYDYAIQNPNQPRRAAFLFPGSDTLPSVEINQWIALNSGDNVSNFVLIAFDGTWKHANEMIHASLPFLTNFAVQVCLSYDAGVDGSTIFDSDLILRKEPFSGCMSTMEAIARCLQVLEPNGVQVEGILVEVLRAMVRFQAYYLKPMKPRIKMLKKGRADNSKTNPNSKPRSFESDMNFP